MLYEIIKKAKTERIVKTIKFFKNVIPLKYSFSFILNVDKYFPTLGQWPAELTYRIREWNYTVWAEIYW